MGSLTLSQPHGRRLTGGDLVAQCLKALGVEVAFGLGGGHLDAVLLGCEDNGIKLYDTRHETVAVQAAEGYYKTSGKVGVSFVTAASGFSNALPGLSSASADNNAIVLITSSQPQRDIGTNGLQGAHDQVALAMPITKFAHRVVHASEIPRVMAHAFRIAVGDGPGPVMLDIPIELMMLPVDQENISWGAIADPPTYPPGPHEDAIEALVQLWKSAERPAIIAEVIGRGEGKSTVILEAVAEATSTPVFHSLNYGPAVPYKHPLEAGPANQLALLLGSSSPRPDLIILMGARPSTFTGARGGFVLPKAECKIVQIDPDGREIGKMHRVDLGMQCEPEQALRKLKTIFQANKLPPRKEWLDIALKLKTSPLKKFENSAPSTNDALHPFHAIYEIAKSLDPGAIFICDGGEASWWGLDVAPTNQAHLSIYACGIMGFLGNGWGYALGAAAAAPSRQIVHIQGDGSAGFHIAELDTYARFKLNILTVIMNNSLWGMSWHAQEMNWGAKFANRPMSILSTRTSFQAVAQGFENGSDRITRIHDISGAVNKFRNQEGPYLLDVVVSESPTHPGLESLVKGNMDPSNPPYFCT
ncbi:uncharacterized protein A1O5_01756 [Cladophialophora psammophila CBS 110553]|uniref:Uncharacterized protein n=1 Tax=Cladophialophora psammophila CBS 110553 TaxID=1182543 RepID=W9XCL8_9EURO|nr:uncharacterized protein A1O5_01756 [Cladophialophora psammophila CBS 110553]EXJ75060.1 hypothetical protein A1O5_01756 [Cladophialophora psammophila CBS 110553]